ncbi:hypothetical protein WDU94_007150 [Cyamophila willieti]
MGNEDEDTKQKGTLVRTQIPTWYTDLSNQQEDIVNNLHSYLRQDALEINSPQTCKFLDDLGIHPPLSVVQITSCLERAHYRPAMFQSKRRIIIQHNKQVRQRREQYMDKLKRVNYKQDIISEIVNNELVTNKKLNYQYQKSILKFKILKEMYDTLESERQDLSLKLYPQLKYEPKQLTCKRFDWYKVSGLPEDALKSFEALMEQRPVSSDVLSDTFPNNIFSDISEGAPEEMNIQTNSSIMSSTSTINRVEMLT